MFNELTTLIIIVYALTGVFAGLVGGMLGLGGGIIIVPVLHYVFIALGFPSSTIMHIAVTTSLCTIVVTSLSAGYTHYKKDAVLWPLVLRLTPGILLGACAGALLADKVTSDTLRILFGLFEIGIAVQIGFAVKHRRTIALPGTAGLIGSGVGIGTVSTLLGIGGGTLTVPFLLCCNTDIRNAVAVSAACGFPIAVAGSTAMIIASLNNPELPANTLGYLYWPAALIIIMTTIISAPIGARLAHYLPVITLKRFFAVILFIVGIKMLIQG